MSDAAVKGPPSRPAATRIDLLDIARGLALFAMASYHFSWDLELFGYLDQGLTTHGLFKAYARSIAGSFLFLAGVSLMLAHGSRFRPPAFAKRLAMVGGAAALITLVTVFAFPFGILHAIAAASVVGLAFLKLPGLVTVLAGIGCLVLPHVYRSAAFDPIWLNWIGLFETTPRSNDFVPLLPWLGPFLLGMGATRLAVSAGLTQRLAAIRAGSGPLARATRFCGRHSLAFYLVHQPVLLALVWTASQLAPPSPADPVPGFIAQCEAGCEQGGNDAAFCVRFCGCVTDDLRSGQLLEPLLAGKIDGTGDSRITAIAEQCTALSARP
ncbi:DUF1624 domain-containing protein [Hoeflea olei]|uniref:Heparan-alpha-glucosaminide N-acetyltransferase catalytic domain-containing protein n=1 Tax=Hoeflea olei TaxID=1480615 RepID=A0A1C1YSU9_9HYPH|nr:heparan-alpha-glucosaminide N-acetyltransferase [Hoeflea olei]OCW56609.1 hypothetical protein AWJ14_16855 [Hoeflea olei]